MHATEALSSRVQSRNHGTIGTNYSTMLVTTDSSHGVMDNRACHESIHTNQYLLTTPRQPSELRKVRRTNDSNVESVINSERCVGEEAFVERVALGLRGSVVVVKRRLQG